MNGDVHPGRKIKHYNNMEKERSGEIALALLKYQIAHEGMRLGPETKRELVLWPNSLKFPSMSLKNSARN